jgi:FKBP-type peptidyl-prolyl cis-trans isomerase
VAKPHQRAFAFILAILFLLTSVGAGVAVIWQIKQDNKNNAAVSEDTQNEQQNQTDTSQQPTQENALKGTKLEGFTPVVTVDKLQVTDIKEGTGAEAKKGATVTAHYTGAIAKDGVIFESSHDSGSPATFPLGNVIKGWQEGVPGMKVGGKRRLIIPYALAYGEAGNPPVIPAKADLVFDIELTAVQ